MAYQFTHPIRYYKANDPYYYEVDNIPLRQLEENVLYLKDIVAGDSNLGGVLTATSELDLKNIKQLRPTREGNRGIKVNAGWFNARINDAYTTSQPLLNLLNRSNPTGGGPDIITNIQQIWTGDQRRAIWDSFITNDINEGASPYNMNGLEIAYTFHQSPGGIGGHWGITHDTNPRATGDGTEAYPKYQSGNRKTWPLQLNAKLTPANLGQIFGKDLRGESGYSYENLQDIHLAFVKTWRSPYRTAVVDFPESVIQIPAFDEFDYYYYGNDGLPQSLEDMADQRIDLLVAYSLPVDASAATLGDYSDTWCAEGTAPQPRTITQPLLGLIRGAGVGLKRDWNVADVTISVDTTEPCMISKNKGGVDPGGRKIAANLNDTAITANYGLKNTKGTTIHGSFPSPDDLVNMAPILALASADSTDQVLTTDDRFQLIGQTALPLAYIVVKKGERILGDEDILDIRPFFRTTELSYNERAGVAAANPPLSLANPAVGTFQLQDVIDELDLGSIDEAAKDGKVIYADYIQGGLAYGVEGTLLTMCDEIEQSSSDPWGSTTTRKTYKDSHGTDHDFSIFGSSKAYLQSTNSTLRKALLEYFYKERQVELKRWLSNPSNTNQLNNNYLGFPDKRNISLWPEWDLPVDATSYRHMMESSKFRSPEATWWMWLEGVTSDRPYSYVPGGVPSQVPNDITKTWLSKKYVQGFGEPTNTGKENLEYFTITCSKRIDITLPRWCSDYEVIVDYSNCTPFTASIAKDSSNGTAGLSVNKGPVYSANGINRACFTINSISCPLPAYSDGMIVDGRIMDKSEGTSTTAGSQISAIKDRIYEWLSYSVITPQYEQTNYATNIQKLVPDSTRTTPKIGAAYYPTVSFKIIGFERNPILKSLGSVHSTIHWTGTYIPIVTADGRHDDILATPSIAPVYDENSQIDLSDT